RPQNFKELFNLRHAMARNCIERTFGVIKRRFRLLGAAPEYSLETQSKIILSIFALHNFLQSHDPDDGSDVNEMRDHPQHTPEPSEYGAANVSREETVRAGARRDAIAQEMWSSYVNYIADH
ncbi:hypothetical protein SCHPADRAFT_808114, partial [Schizopora paradoxa]